jgi:CheY-like chemotaxis protein
VRTGRPHVVLLDITMPGVDGFEVVRRLRKDPELGGTRFVALSGHSQEEYRRRAREAGFHDYFVKPIALESLLTLVAKNLDAV